MSFSQKQQREQALRDEQARERSRESFLAGGTPDELEVIRLFGEINKVRFNLTPSLERRNEGIRDKIREIIAGGNVNPQRIQNRPENFVRDFFTRTVTKLTESMRDEVQFFSAPTTIFEQFGVQAEPISTIGSRTVPQQIGFPIKMDQVTFPTYTEQQLRIRVQRTVSGQVKFTAVDPQLNGQFVFRILVIDLLSNTTKENKISFTIRAGFSPSISWSQEFDSNRVRVELQAFTTQGVPATNVFNETKSFEDIPPPPPTTKTCQCIDPRTGKITITTGHPINEVCPVCKLPPVPPPPDTKFCECTQRFIPISQVCPTCPPPPPPIDLTPNIFDKGIVALLAIAALMPRGKKK